MMAEPGINPLRPEATFRKNRTATCGAEPFGYARKRWWNRSWPGWSAPIEAVGWRPSRLP